MQSVSSRIWTRVAVFISYDNNDYTTGSVYPNMDIYLVWHKASIGWVCSNDRFD